MPGVNIDPRLFDISSPTWDSFIILGYCAAVIIYSFFASRERLTVVLVSIYTALAITSSTPYLTDYFGSLDPSVYLQYRLWSFVGAFIVLFLLFSHNMAMRSDGQRWWQGIALSALQVGLLMSSILLFVPQEFLHSAIARDYFTSDIARSFWMLSPVLVMLVMRRKKEEK